jgi:hypothetical protein
MKLTKKQTEKAIRLLKDSYEFINFIKQDEGEDVEPNKLDLQISEFLEGLDNSNSK